MKKIQPVLSLILAALTLLACAQITRADDTVYVPPELEPWTEWVLEDIDGVDCPLSPTLGQAVCVWSGPLQIAVRANGATFEQRIDSREKQYLTLPGDRTLWPQAVRIDNQEVALTARDGRPAVQIEKGTFTVRGEFEWKRTPATLALPGYTGLVSLTLNGQPVANPRWRPGTLWIQNRTSPSDSQIENRIDMDVHRTIRDGAPPLMSVTLNLDIAGQNREVSLGKLLPDGFSPTFMRSQLPARLDSDGHLRVQVRPGTWVINFSARTVPPLSTLAFEPAGDVWPTEEIWSYQSDPRLRVTEASAPNPVDPSQVGVPGNAQELPAFRMTAGDVLTLSERQRGFSSGARSDLALARTMWLGFDGDQYVVRDVLTGTLRQDWRLDVAPPMTLQSASLRDGSNLLVTQATDDAAVRGVEVRTPTLHLTTLAETDAAAALPVSGWRTRVSGVNTQVHLPPGQRLLAAFGVDHSHGDWASKWNLLDFFLILVVAAALWRLHAPWLGVLGLVALILTVHEPNAPRWSWLALVSALAACRFVPAGRLRQFANLAAAVCLLSFAVIAVPFVAKQLQWAVFPQLQLQRGVQMNMDVRSATAPVPEMMNIEEEAAAGSMNARRAQMDAAERAVAVTASRSKQQRKSSFSRYAQGSQVQTGPGVPQWQWRTHRLSWSGPVSSDQTFRMVILPSWLMSVWRLLAVALLLGVVGIMLKRDLVKVLPKAQAASAASVGLVAIVMALSALTQAPVANAQTPSAELLSDLQKRLTRKPKCLPNCATIARADVRYDAATLSIALIAHAQTDVALMLPGDPGGWYPTEISVNGARTQTMRTFNNLKTSGAAFAVPLTAGVHRLILKGNLPNAGSLALNFPLVPFHVTAQGSGWETGGLSDNTLAGGALTLTREVRQDANKDEFDAMDVEQFPAFVTVERTLNFDLDWTVSTVVRRSTPPSAPISLKVPLLPGEAINTANLNVLNGVVSVNLAPGQDAISWSSTLERTSPVILRAAGDVPWQERWFVNTSVNWRLTHSGVPNDNVDPATLPSWRPSFTPWPSETLELVVQRPAPVDGPTLAIDGVTLTTEIGRRGSDSTLDLKYRATNGGQHLIMLPPGSELSSLTSDGVSLARSLNDGKLALPITPGTHRAQITWRTDTGSGLVMRTQDVDVGQLAANVYTQLRISPDRWVLWTSGPRVGPAVLYWSEFAALILVAWLLARFTQTPLKFVHWLLLGLGFSTFFWPAFAAVIVALLAFRWRETRPLTSRIVFNATQFGLAAAFFAAAMALLTTIPFGLLGSADMGVTGNGSSSTWLRWFCDRADGMLPSASVKPFRG